MVHLHYKLAFPFLLMLSIVAEAQDKQPADEFRQYRAEKRHAVEIIRPDSTPQSLSSNAFHKIKDKNLAVDVLKDFKSLENLKGLIRDSFFLPLRKPFEQLALIYKRPLMLNQVSVDYTGATHDAYFGGQAAYMQALDINTTWSVMGIPYNMGLYGDQWSMLRLNHPVVPDFKTVFNRDQYLAALKQQLSNKIDFAGYVANLEDPLSDLKSGAERALRQELQSLSKTHQQFLQQQIKELGSIDNLLTTDVQALRQRYLNPAFIESVAANETLFEQLQNKLSAGQAVDTAEYARITTALQEARLLQDLVGVLSRHKKNWEHSGLIAKIKQLDLLKKERVQDLLKDPATITRLAKQHLQLNSLQRLFLKINKLGLGQQVATASPLALNHFLNNGVSLELLNNGKHLSGLMGRNQQTTSLLDLPFNATPAVVTQARALSMGRGEAGKGQAYSRVSVMRFNQSLQPDAQGLQVLNHFRQTLATTFTKSLAVGKSGTVLTEVSRSVSNHEGSSSENKTVERLFSADDFLSNTAFHLRYDDAFPGLNLVYGLRAGKVANGYNNPGSPFLNNGSTEAGLNVRKSFWKNKVQVAVRTDLRAYKYNDEGEYKWRNRYTVVDLKWRVKKGHSLSLRYLPSRMYRFSGGTRENITRFDQLSVDAQLSKKLGRKYYTVYSSLATQSNYYAVNGLRQGNRSLIFLLNQTVAVGTKMIYWNTSLNQAHHNDQAVYFNSQLASEAGLSYIILKKLQASTTVSYNSVAKWYQQAGLRQSMSCRLNERFEADFFVDLRKNIQLHQPLLFGLSRGQVSFHYSFNQN